MWKLLTRLLCSLLDVKLTVWKNIY
jgi:hypothetical protein